MPKSPKHNGERAIKTTKATPEKSKPDPTRDKAGEAKRYEEKKRERDGRAKSR